MGWSALLTVWVCKTSSWNYTSSSDNVAGSPEVILGDIKSCSHICVTLLCVLEVKQKTRHPLSEFLLLGMTGKQNSSHG